MDLSHATLALVVICLAVSGYTLFMLLQHKKKSPLHVIENLLIHMSGVNPLLLHQLVETAKRKGLLDPIPGAGTKANLELQGAIAHVQALTPEQVDAYRAASMQAAQRAM